MAHFHAIVAHLILIALQILIFQSPFGDFVSVNMCVIIKLVLK